MAAAEGLCVSAGVSRDTGERGIGLAATGGLSEVMAFATFALKVRDLKSRRANGLHKFSAGREFDPTKCYAAVKKFTDSGLNSK